MKERPDDVIELDDDDETIYSHYADWLLVHKSKSTVMEFWNAVAAVRKFLEKNDYSFEELGEGEALEFCNWLEQDSDISSKSAESYMGRLSGMVSYYVTRGYFAYNPIEMALSEYEFEYSTETNKRRVPLDELREGIVKIKRPLVLVTVTLLLKTGIRRSEAYNLDLRDIHLAHPISEIMPSPRSEIADTPNSIYIDSTIKEGQTINGEYRTNGNKKDSTRVIPIDSELKSTLVWWIAAMPPTTSPAEPLLRDNRKKIGQRRRWESIGKDVTDWSKNNGWWSGEGPERDVTAHWCRHWFTTMLRRRVDDHEVLIGDADDYVNALRGDAGGILDVYTHDWEEEDWIRTVYETNIPKLFN